MIANAAPWSFALKQLYLADFPPTRCARCTARPSSGSTRSSARGSAAQAGSCGKAAPIVEIRLYDDDGNVVTGTGPDATGELYVRSPSVFADYYKQHDKFEEDMRDGFQTVGDIAYRDDEGYYYICDRKKDMIISGGMNIYPAEIEAGARAHPDIYEAAGVRHPVRGVGRDGARRRRRGPGPTLDEAAGVAHAREHLAGYKVPRSVSWIGRAPEDRLGQDPQARAARPVLVRPRPPT